MKCVVPCQNVKVLAKAFHSLGRIGDDLFIEPHKNHLAFRTVNMAESAYASFTFTRTFFSSFTFSEDDSEEALRSKISMKSLLVVLKPQHGERLIEWCQIRIDPNSTKVIFQLRYSYGCTKTHFLPILESETLQANYSKDDSQNRLSASPKLISTAVKNFRTNEDEVTLCVMSQKLVLKNHLENNLDSKKALKTEICLYPAEFETYTIEAQTSVTFCLKELRAVLLFAEFTGLPICFYLSKPGKPVVFVVSNDDVYEANYVVSTLNESGSSQPISQQTQSSVTTCAGEEANSKKRRREDMDEGNKSCLTPPVNCIDLPNRSTHTVPSLTTETSFNPANMTGVTILNNSVNGSGPSQCVQHSTADSNITQPIVKAIFGRCFNTTFKKQSVPGYDKVLAYDSDGMEDSD